MSLKRSALKRRSPLARVSPKRKAQQAEYAAAKATVLARDGGACRAKALWPEVECGGPIDPHHIWPVGRFPEYRCDPERIVSLCRRHHDACHHGDPQWARRIGILR